MGRLKALSGAGICKILESNGSEQVRQKGSYSIMQKNIGSSTVTVPVPLHKELKIGTLQSIIRQSNLGRELFEACNAPIRNHYFWSNADEAFIADVPELPGCKAHGNSQRKAHGNSQREALDNAQEAIELWLDTAREFGDRVPEPKRQRLVDA